MRKSSIFGLTGASAFLLSACVTPVTIASTAEVAPQTRTQCVNDARTAPAAKPVPTWLSAIDYGEANRSAADLSRMERDARTQDRLYRDCLARQNG